MSLLRAPYLPLALVLGALGAPALAAEKSATATRTEQSPRIDGDLGDPAWASATPLVDFTQRLPDEGSPVSERTEVRVLYDDRAIYFGFRCFDSKPEAIATYMARRDNPSASDYVTIDLDTRGDHTSAYNFEVSAAGVQRDALRTGDDALDYNWDAVWASAVKQDGQGWTAEIAIPVTALRYERESTNRWHIQFKRFIARRNETALWSFMSRLDRGEMLRYRRLDGLERLSQPRGFHLRPFLLGRLRNRSAPLELGLPNDSAPAGSAGIDLRYGITSGLSLDLTGLPDFGQVEADPAILNLSTFEYYHPEKRPFFLEGAELFTFPDTYGNVQPAQIFYSRRVGAAAPSPHVPDGASLVDAPERILILGAAKLTGRITDRISVGLLDAVTAPSRATLTSTAGGTQHENVTSLANYLAARAQAQLTAGLKAGAAFTQVLHAEEAGALGLDGICPGGALPGGDGRCTHDATTAALDVSWQSADGAMAASGTLLASLISGGAPRTLADGVTIASGDRDLGWRFQFAKPGGNFYTELLYDGYGPKLDLNDVGYLRSQNIHRVFAMAGIHGYSMGPAREAAAALMLGGLNSFDGVNLAREVGGELVLKLNSFWDSGAKCAFRARAFDNRETRDGSIAEKPANFLCELWTTTSRSAPFYFVAWGVEGTTWNGSWLDVGSEIGFRPLTRLDLNISPTLSMLSGDPRWVDTLAVGQYLFGLQRAFSAGVTLRSTYTFNPRLTLQAYAQLFFASVRYDELYSSSPAAGGRTLYVDDFVPTGDDPSRYDERDAVLNVNLVLRWEYLPGSELFLVYTRGHAGGLAAPERDTSGNPIRPPPLDFGALGRAPVEDVLLAKLSYYFAG